MHTEAFLRRRVFTFVLALFAAGMATGGTEAFAAIAKIAKCSGEVIVRSGGELRQVTAPGAQLNDGDQIQTKQGEAEVLFEDGAVLKVNPFTNAMLNERAEKEGFWVFRTVRQARRITCFVGKMFFQSGSSGRKNYLQTPTAVAGLRGTAADFGYNPDRLQTLMNLYSGASDTIGNVLQGFFQNPGISAAQKSAVFQGMERAYSLTVETQRVNRGVATTEQRTINTAQANIAALEVVRQAAQLLVQGNPDPAAQTQARATIAAVNAGVNAVQVQAEAAKTEIVRQAAVQEVQKAQAEGDAQKLAAAQSVVAAATAAETQARAAATQVAQQAAQAVQALAQGNLTQAQQIAQATQEVAQQVQQATQQVTQQARNIITTAPATSVPTTVPTTVETTAATTATTTVPTTAATTVETTVATTVATVVATTTVETTARSTTTTTTTSSTTTSVTPSR